MNMEAQKPNTSERFPDLKRIPTSGDEVHTKDRNGKSIIAELVSVNGNKAVVGYYDERKQWVEIPKKLSEVTFVPIPTKTIERPVIIEAESVSVVPVIEEASLVEKKLVPAQVLEPVVAAAPEVATPESTSEKSEVFNVEKIQKLIEEVLEKSGYTELEKQKIRLHVKRRLDLHKRDPQKQEEALMEYFHRLAQDWEYENEEPLMLPDQLILDMAPLNTFLGNPANRQKISASVYLKLVQLQKKLVGAYTQLQAVDAPNPSESDPKTRKNILRKYTNIARGALAEADAIINTPDKSLLEASAIPESPKLDESDVLQSTEREPVRVVDIAQSLIEMVEKGTYPPQLKNLLVAQINATIEQYKDHPAERDRALQVILDRLSENQTVRLAQNFSPAEETKDPTGTPRTAGTNPFISYIIQQARQASEQPAQVGEPMKDGLSPLSTNAEPEPLTDSQSSVTPTEALPTPVQPLQLTPAMRISTPPAIETEITAPLSTRMPIPSGPAIQMIRTEDVPLSENTPNVERPRVRDGRSRPENALPMDEKLYALRRAKDSYIQALTEAIKIKTVHQKDTAFVYRDAYDQFMEGALATIATTRSAYDTLLSAAQVQLVQDVSSKFSIPKDSEVANLERNFYDEGSVTVERIKNAAGVLARGFAFLPTYAAKRAVSSLLHVDILKEEAEERRAERLRTDPILQKPPVAPLPGVQRTYSKLADEVPADRDMSFIVPEPQGEAPIPESPAEYSEAEDIADSERVAFPTPQSIDLDIPDAEFSAVVRPVGDMVPSNDSGAAERFSVSSHVAESGSLPESALTLEKIYGFRDQFPGGREAFSDKKQEWIYTAEGLHGIRPEARIQFYFGDALRADPYRALADKSVQEILLLQKRRSGIHADLEKLHITEAGFGVWAKRLEQFVYNHPTFDIHALSLAQAVDILFAADRLTRAG